MKHIGKLTAAICLLALLTGCASPSARSSAIPDTEAPSAQTGLRGNAEYTLYFPDDGSYSYSHSIGAEETVYVREIIKTNTTQIRVTNEGDTAIVCNLYDPDNISDAILTHTMEPGKSAVFSNLTSAQTYCIGFQAAEEGNVKVSISG